MATADIIAAADFTPKPSVTKDSWSPHLLADAYALLCVVCGEDDDA